MMTKCYAIEMSTNIESMFDALNDYGFDYYCDEDRPATGYMEIYIDCYPHEVCALEDIMKWYV